MYNPETFLTREVLSEILAEFSWPDKYDIDERDCTVDGIKVRFPMCILYFNEGFESDMRFFISNPLSRENKYWTSFELINYIYRPSLEITPNYSEPQIKVTEPFASLEKVQDGIRNICILVQYYLMDCVKGDFSLIEKFKQENPNFLL